ncbi:MAG TPA: YitT family protein, partial [Chitinophagaceae bacterium]|nr:YitT family protein [Chitinophagaceae bacterium]
MNPQFLNIIRTQIKQALGMTDTNVSSRYMTAKRARQERRNILHMIRDVLFMFAGVLSAGFGLKGFLIPNNFIDGGVMGISLLIHEKT